MSSWVKLLIGLAAVLLMGWVYHGPLGNGAAFIGELEAQARSQVEDAGVPGVSVRLGRDPLSRGATLSGPANDLQREGLGSQPGLNDLVAAIPGVSGIAWEGEGSPGGVPLIAELLLLLTAAYLVGVGLAWLLFGRKKREGFV